MRENLAPEISLDTLLERHDLRVAQVGVRLGVPVPVAAKLSSVVALSECAQHRLDFRGGEPYFGGLIDLTQIGEKSFAIFINLLGVCLGEGGQQLLNLLLPLLA